MTPAARGTLVMPVEYDTLMAGILEEVADDATVKPDVLAGCWPRVGRAFRHRLLVVGRAVNGSVDRVMLADLRAEDGPGNATAALRATAEGDAECPMAWVSYMWGNPGGYSTARSAFWRTVRRALAKLDPDSVVDAAWSSRLAWSNLAKLAPWGGGNPGGPLLDIQRRLGPDLLAMEVATLQPEVVLVLAGRWWAEPLLDALGLEVEWRDGLLEGTARDGERRWVIGPHPQGKPRALWDELAAAL